MPKNGQTRHLTAGYSIFFLPLSIYSQSRLLFGHHVQYIVALVEM